MGLLKDVAVEVWERIGDGAWSIVLRMRSVILDDIEALADRAIRNRAERQAETDAEEALETDRVENNRILQDWKMGTLARLMDGM